MNKSLLLEAIRQSNLKSTTKSFLSEILIKGINDMLALTPAEVGGRAAPKRDLTKEAIRNLQTGNTRVGNGFVMQEMERLMGADDQANGRWDKQPLHITYDDWANAVNTGTEDDLQKRADQFQVGQGAAEDEFADKNLRTRSQQRSGNVDWVQ